MELTSCLFKVGRHDEAVKYNEEGIASLRQLVVADFLYNTAGVLWSSNRPESAIPLLQESIGLYRTLLGTQVNETIHGESNGTIPSPEKPGDAEHMLATSLQTLVGLLYDEGDQAAAVKMSEEGLSIFRGLVAGGDNTMESELANALNENAWFTAYYAESSEEAKKGAIGIAQESVGILRRLIVGSPDVVDDANLGLQRHLLNSLDTLMHCYNGCKLYDEALYIATNDAINMHHLLHAMHTKQGLDVHLQSVDHAGAAVFKQYAVALDAVGRTKEAVLFAKEAVEIGKRLVPADPVKNGKQLEKTIALLDRLTGTSGTNTVIGPT
ncbi:hypothetical protein FA15DRAFT_703826 [Coprinopsis marcescibilis]|uniref:TPR-like protein n=1 Tax=Coprinopsis marcescibilis TaxID=230819 RepID=A0A5C3LAJ0_COPMA|nr:hypothetical protein FA15DRAFT_703826 [Coprinopsis marcescibilis]